MYRHGVYSSEVPTSIVPPVPSYAGLPVVFGTAPIHMAKNPAKVNTPVLCFTYQEAVEALGYSDDWKNYTLCEFIYSQFALFGVAPVVLINVLDPAVHKESVASKTVALTNGVGTIDDVGIKMETLELRLEAAGQPLAKMDYVAGFDSAGKVTLSRVASGSIPEKQASLVAKYEKLKPSMVTKDDIIGGIDVTTGQPEGLELINQILPRFMLLPGLILAPGWSTNPEVAAIMKAKASNVNGHFKVMTLNDVPTNVVKRYTDVAAWKNSNNYVDALEIDCWPKVKMGDRVYHLSTQLAGVICKTDAANEDIPYVSPSNKSLQANGAVLEDGTEVILGPDQATYLDSQGIVTALNFSGGWRVWGNRTGCYPASTDVKDAFIPIRRMFNWIGNTLVQTFWSKVDFPLNRRLIDTVIDSANIWMNALTAREMILGGRVVLVKAENPVTDLMDGIVRFHVYVTPPSPAREIDFILEYDPKYVETLFG